MAGVRPKVVEGGLRNCAPATGWFPYPRTFLVTDDRWQYIGSGLKDERFPKILGDMVTEAQMKRISAALAPILN